MARPLAPWPGLSLPGHPVEFRPALPGAAQSRQARPDQTQAPTAKRAPGHRQEGASERALPRGRV
eukprot:scaffold58685_cov65-Phaeocystis_antarctica.AAC.2